MKNTCVHGTVLFCLLMAIDLTNPICFSCMHLLGIQHLEDAIVSAPPYAMMACAPRPAVVWVVNWRNTLYEPGG